MVSDNSCGTGVPTVKSRDGKPKSRKAFTTYVCSEDHDVARSGKNLLVVLKRVGVKRFLLNTNKTTVAKANVSIAWHFFHFQRR